MKILLSLILLTFLSCNQSGDSSSGATPDRKPVDNTGDSSNPSKCVTNKVLEVLKDRKSVLSTLSKDPSSLVVWDYQSLDSKAQIKRSKSFYQISPSGEFMLRQINPRQYLIEHLAPNSSYQETLYFYGIVTSLDFSLKSDFVVATYRYRGNADRISIFDVVKRELVFVRSLRNIKYVKMIDDENLFVVAGFGISNVLYHYNIARDKMRFFKLESGDLRWLGISKNIVIANIDHSYVGYDLNSGDFKFEKKLNSIYDLEYESDLAIVSGTEFNQLGIMNMQTGEILHTTSNLEDINLSSCRFTTKHYELICQSKAQSNKISLWNLEQNTTRETCY